MKGLPEEPKVPVKVKVHPYLHGNFAPIHRTLPLTPCTYTGTIPKELAGGQYVRNGGNPVTNEDLGRDAHWFDGDGMLAGVLFRRKEDDSIQPEFVNQYILTDAYLSTITTPSLRSPMLPSIATLVNPASTIFHVMLRIMRTILLVILSRLPGSQHTFKKLSVANTSFLYHDGRALATCESGVPMRMTLPELSTVGWFDGQKAQGEPFAEKDDASEQFGGEGLLGFMKEWTTAHPRVDPVTKDLILYHSISMPPFVNYSVIPSTYNIPNPSTKLINVGVPGIKSSKMMHDFGASRDHTVIMDLPLSLDIMNMARNLPVVAYDTAGKSRFGVFPRYDPSATRWFETNPCCIFHTANTWDEPGPSYDNQQQVSAVNLLACRLTTASVVYDAGDIAAPIPKATAPSDYPKEPEQCRLYYFRFPLDDPSSNTISHQFALSSVPFEFPSLRDDVSMTEARYIYGCSVSEGKFGSALGRAAKIDCLVKMDVIELIRRGKQNPPAPIVGVVDDREVLEILKENNPDDHIKIFHLPPGIFAQESRFVPRENGTSEDDGWILAYTFDEAQLDDNGEVMAGARSELWVIDAKNMKDVVCKVQLPQRVPYGLHGSWIPEEDLMNQRPVESLRSIPKMDTEEDIKGKSFVMRTWLRVRGSILEYVG